VKAPNGAATTPPITSPAMIGQSCNPIVAKNVNEIVSVTKNSAMLTEPMA